jgi:hypothetical protein
VIVPEAVKEQPDGLIKKIEAVPAQVTKTSSSKPDPAPISSITAAVSSIPTLTQKLINT